MKNMMYYIAESSQKELFTTSLIKRFESYDEAVEFLKKAVAEWSDEGLNSFLTYDEDVRHNPELLETAQVWGAEALDEEYYVKHHYMLFATPIFMGGGTIG